MKRDCSKVLLLTLSLLAAVEGRNSFSKPAAARLAAAAQASPATRTAQKCLAGALSAEVCSINPLVAFSSSLGRNSSLPDRCDLAAAQCPTL
jgi:hypothetical protein